MLKTAMIWADESSCERAKVGCVIAKESRIISTGYNGTISGFDNCCEDACEVCGGSGEVLSYEQQYDRCERCERCGGKGLTSKKTVIHAEANAILFASKNGICTEGGTAYVTLSPCIECSKMIIQSGIKRVVFSKHYRKDEGVEFLRDAGIEVDFLKIN
jgi:dCMP deaminase